jgi:hypothetical protein
MISNLDLLPKFQIDQNYKCEIYVESNFLRHLSIP